MAKDIVLPVHSFAAGVLSSTLDARSDLERYYISARTLNNVFVMRSGAAANRAGFEYLGNVKTASKPVRLESWLFDEDDRYVLECGEGYIRFWQDGARVLVDTTDTLGAWATTSYYNPGDLVWAIGSGAVVHIFYAMRASFGATPVSSPSDWLELTNVETVPLVVGIFEVPAPYDDLEVFDVRFQQSGDVTWITHPTHPPYELKRYSAFSWTMLPADFAPPIRGPYNLSASKGGAATDITDAYKITAVKHNTFEESLPGAITATTKSTSAVSGGGGSDVRITSTSYGISNGTTILCIRVYPTTGTKNPQFEAALLNKGFTLSVVTANTFDLVSTDGITVPSGYFADFAALSSTLDTGTTTGTVDDNGGIGAAAHGLVTGDEILIVWASSTTAEAFAAIVGKTWTVTVISANAFSLDDSTGIDWTTAVGTIWFSKTYITIAHGITSAASVTVTCDPVEGAEKYYVYKRANGVFGYLATVSEISSSGLVTYTDLDLSSVGHGADTSDTPPRYYNPFRGTDKYPAAVGMHDQRLAFAATNDEPGALWLSKTGDFLNFTHSSPFKDDDSIKATIIGAQEIRHLLDLDQLLVVSNAGIYFMEGDQDGTLIPQNIRARQRVRIGASGVAPLIVDDSVLFVAQRGGTVRDFRLDAVEFQKGRDLTAYASALVDGHTLSQWAFQRNPHSLLWAVRDDGKLLGLTYVREQEIAAWHTHDTGQAEDYGQNDRFESVAVIPDGDEDSVYAVVKRVVNPVYEFGAKYEPPIGYCAMGLGQVPENNRALKALSNNTGYEMIPSTADVSGGSGSNIRITSTGSSASSTAHGSHGLVDGQTVTCTTQWASDDADISGAFHAVTVGESFTVTAATSTTFDLSGTSGITVPANQRLVFIKDGILTNAPMMTGIAFNCGSNGHGSPSYGAPGTLQTNKALSGGGGSANVRITTATPPSVGQWVKIIDVDPSAGPPDLAFEALLEGNTYLVSAISAGAWFEIAATSGITVPATQQADYQVLGTLPSWPGALGTAVFDAPLSGGAGAGPGGSNINIIVTSATTPTEGQRVLIVDVTRTAGAAQTAFEVALEAHSYEAITVVAGVSFRLKGTSTITVPASQIVDFTLVTGDITFWTADWTAAELVTFFTEADSQGFLPCMHATIQDQSVTPKQGLDDVLVAGTPTDKYQGILAQLSEIGVALGTWNKPTMLHIMGECNASGNNYHRADFADAFGIARNQIRTVANSVLTSSFNKCAVAWNVVSNPGGENYAQWAPSSALYDWASIDLFQADKVFFENAPVAFDVQAFFDFARGAGKPVYIPETGAVGTQIPDILPDQDNGGQADEVTGESADDLARRSAANAWKIWFGPMFDFIERNPIVKLVRWYEQNFVGGEFAEAPFFWRNSRVGNNKFLLAMWMERIREGHYIGQDQLALLNDYSVNHGDTAEPDTGGTTTRTIERMRPRKAGEATDYDERLDSYFVDSGTTWDGRNIADSAMEDHATTTLALTGGTTWLAGSLATLTATITAPVVTGPFVAGDVNSVGYRITDPFSGDEVEVHVVAFTSDLIVTVELQQDATNAILNGEDATEWTKMVSSYAGMDRLESRLLWVLGDGKRWPDVAVADGAVVFQKPLGIVHFGIPVPSIIETLDFDIPGQAAAGKLIRPVELTAIVHNTRGVLAGPAGNDDSHFPLRETPVLNDSETALFSGKATCKMQASARLKSSIVIRQPYPFPMLIEGIFPIAEVPK